MQDKKAELHPRHQWKCSMKKDITDQFFKKGSWQKRGDTKELKEQLLRVLKTNQLDKGIKKNKVFTEWNSIVGRKSCGALKTRTYR